MVCCSGMFLAKWIRSNCAMRVYIIESALIYEGIR